MLERLWSNSYAGAYPVQLSHHHTINQDANSALVPTGQPGARLGSDGIQLVGAPQHEGHRQRHAAQVVGGTT